MKMKMQLFGEFLLYTPDAAVGDKSLHSKKMVRLLALLLMNRDKNMTRQELIDALWDEDCSRNPDGALKNLVYRLRTELEVFGEQELIMTRPGIYRWNPKVTVEADYEQLEQMARAARIEKDPQRQRQFCEAADSVFKNEVSTRLATESWMISRITYFRLLYIENAKLLAGIYAAGQNWNALEALCRRVLDIEALEEDIHYWLIRSQIGKKNYEQAAAYYNNAKQLFYDNLGIRDIERFDDLYVELMNSSDQQTSNMGGLLASVNEKERPDSVFFCEYPVFREIYRVEARRIQRTGIAEYILLITMKKSGGASMENGESSLQSGMQALAQQLKDQLRTGDVAARYSASQYVLLLPSCTYESVQMVIGRIQRKFNRNAARWKVALNFEIEEVQSTSLQV